MTASAVRIRQGPASRGLRDRVDALDGALEVRLATRWRYDGSGSSCPCRGDQVRDTVTERTGGRWSGARNKLAPGLG